MFRNARGRKARRYAQMLWLAHWESEGDQELAGLVQQRLRPGTYVDSDAGILITEMGYVTMAILPAYGRCFDDALVVPGIDNCGTRGFLVLRPERAPFHSLAQTAEDALLDTLTAHGKADEIVASFGSRAALRAAVREVPWYTISKVTDLESSGLCEWGARSFLRRYGLYTLTYRVGLPRALFRMSGAYGDRVTAATLLRRKLERQQRGFASGTVAFK